MNVKKKVLVFPVLLIALFLMCTTVSMAADDNTKITDMVFSVMYEGAEPAVGSVRVGHFHEAATLKDISIDTNRQVMSIEFSLEGTGYTWDISNIKVRPMLFKDAVGLEYNRAVSFNNSEGIYIFMTWGESTFGASDFWYADSYGIQYVNPVTKVPVFKSSNAKLGGVRYYFDEWGYIQATDQTSQWLKAGEFDIYCDKKGNIMKNTKTPDGYKVDARGIWIQ